MRLQNLQGVILSNRNHINDGNLTEKNVTEFAQLNQYCKDRSLYIIKQDAKGNYCKTLVF